MASRKESEGIVQAPEGRPVTIARGPDGLVTQPVDEGPQAVCRLRSCPATAPQTFTDLSHHAPHGHESIVLVHAGWLQHRGARVGHGQSFRNDTWIFRPSIIGHPHQDAEPRWCAGKPLGHVRPACTVTETWERSVAASNGQARQNTTWTERRQGHSPALRPSSQFFDHPRPPAPPLSSCGGQPQALRDPLLAIEGVQQLKLTVE
jgi:hypothetical protein